MQTLYAISYYLEQILPKGGIAHVYFPKEILGAILPAIAKEKNCKIVSIGGTKQATQELIKAGVIAESHEEPDVILVEPDGMTADGILLKPEEAKQLKEDAIAVGSISKWASKCPASHDIVQVSKTITEHGIYSLKDLKQELNASSSELSSPYPSSQVQIPTP